jgi:hypothetical protein
MSPKQKPQKEEVKQLDLGIKDPFKNKFLKIKSSINRSILQFEVRKFLKDPLVWSVLTISLIAQQVFIIYQNINSLPVYIPVFKYFLAVEKKLTTTEYVLAFPVISSVVLMTSFYITSRNYNRERLLTKLLLLTVLLVAFSQTVTLIDLIKDF